MGKDNKNIGLFGETAVALELIKLGYDVININSSIHNYKNADLIVMNSKTGKSTMVQVKCGTTQNYRRLIKQVLFAKTSKLRQHLLDIHNINRIICQVNILQIASRMNLKMLDFIVVQINIAQVLAILNIAFCQLAS